MTKQEIKAQLTLNYQSFTSYISNLDNQAFMFSPGTMKWTAGQQLDHIYRALSPLQLILGLPKQLIKLIFRKANRPSKSYKELVEKYTEKLAKGGKASGRFIPGQVEIDKKIVLKNKIETTISKLCKSLDKYSEAELDTLVLPHPLLGKVTLREMMYFTIYHAEHHFELTRNYLEKK